MMFGAKFRGVWRGIICLQSCVLIKKMLDEKAFGLSMAVCSCSVRYSVERARRSSAFMLKFLSWLNPGFCSLFTSPNTSTVSIFSENKETRHTNSISFNFSTPKKRICRKVKGVPRMCLSVLIASNPTAIMVRLHLDPVASLHQR